MHVDLTFNEILSLVGIIGTAGWGVLKLVAMQFARNVGQRFKAIEIEMKEQSEQLNKSIDSRFSNVNLSIEERARLERAEMLLKMEQRHSAYLEKFSTKDEMTTLTQKHDKIVDDIFSYLRRIEERMNDFGKIQEKK